VRIFELTTWKKDDQIPDSVDSFLELIRSVDYWERQQQLQQQQQRQPPVTSSDLSAVGFQRRPVAVVCQSV
jgi:hypothetical protein